MLIVLVLLVTSTIYKDGRYIDKDTATLNSSITDLP